MVWFKTNSIFFGRGDLKIISNFGWFTSLEQHNLGKLHLEFAVAMLQVPIWLLWSVSSHALSFYFILIRYGCSGACANQCVSTFGSSIQNTRVNSFFSCISGNCLTCPAGQFVHNSACYSCTSGYYCNNNERYVVSSGYYSSADKSKQTRCEAGFYCSNGVKGKCSAGSYQPHSGTKRPISCPLFFSLKTAERNEKSKFNILRRSFASRF